MIARLYLLLIFCGGGGGSCWQVRALIKWPASQQKKNVKKKKTHSQDTEMQAQTLHMFVGPSS